jgi:hypothetical protein
MPRCGRSQERRGDQKPLVVATCRRAGFATLDRLLARLHANKVELLMVLDRPEIPLRTNGLKMISAAQ